MVITKKEFDRIQKRLWEVSDALAKIHRGEKEFKEGKTRTEALKNIEEAVDLCFENERVTVPKPNIGSNLSPLPLNFIHA